MVIGNRIKRKMKRRKDMASVYDVAKYILHQQGRMSTMKLQKLCYYAQAWSLVWDDPLFDEDFQAWTNGPVCSELFYATQGKYSVEEDDEPSGDIDHLSENQKDTINRVLEHYGKMDAGQLSQMTHTEDPWKEARKGLPAGVGCDTPITKESMAMYYGGL